MPQTLKEFICKDCKDTGYIDREYIDGEYVTLYRNACPACKEAKRITVV